MNLTTLCHGKNCPLKTDYLRFTVRPDIENPVFFEWSPYNLAKHKCEFIVIDPESLGALAD